MSTRLEGNSISVPKMREKMESVKNIGEGKTYLDRLNRNVVKNYAIKASSHIERDLTNPRFIEILKKLADNYKLTQGKDSDLVFAKKVLQTGLVPYGYDKNKIDGVIGRGTMKALLAFQKEESCKNVYRQLEGSTEFPNFSLDENTGKADLIPNGRTFLALAILAGITGISPNSSEAKKKLESKECKVDEKPKPIKAQGQNTKPTPTQANDLKPAQDQTQAEAPKPTEAQDQTEGQSLSTELNSLNSEKRGKGTLINNFIKRGNDGSFSKDEAEELIGTDGGKSLENALKEVKNNPKKYPNLDKKIISLLGKLKKDEEDISIIKALTTILERVFNIIIPSANAPAGTPAGAPADAPADAPAPAPETAPAESTTENPQEKSVKEMTDALNEWKTSLGFTENVNFKKGDKQYFLAPELTIKGHSIYIGISSSGNYVLFKGEKRLKNNGSYDDEIGEWISNINIIKKALENLKTPDEETKELLLSGNINKETATNILENENLESILNSMNNEELEKVKNDLDISWIDYFGIKEGLIKDIIEKLNEKSSSENIETETTETSPSLGHLNGASENTEVSIIKDDSSGIIIIKAGGIEIGKIIGNMWENNNSNTYENINLNGKKYNITAKWDKNTGKIDLKFEEVVMEDVVEIDDDMKIINGFIVDGINFIEATKILEIPDFLNKIKKQNNKEVFDKLFEITSETSTGDINKDVDIIKNYIESMK